jgi:hypothetical protein
MRMLPFPSVRPSNQMMAQSATQASPSSPNQNARSGQLEVSIVPASKVMKLIKTFASPEIPEGLLKTLKPVIERAKSSDLQHLFVEPLYTNYGGEEQIGLNVLYGVGHLDGGTVSTLVFGDENYYNSDNRLIEIKKKLTPKMKENPFISSVLKDIKANDPDNYGKNFIENQDHEKLKNTLPDKLSRIMNISR